MNITSAKFYTAPNESEHIGIEVVINGVTMHVPLDSDNMHYQEIVRQHEAGELTIANAD